MLINDHDFRNMGPESSISPAVRQTFPYATVIEDCPICNYVMESWQTNPEIRKPNRIAGARQYLNQSQTNHPHSRYP